MNYLADAGDFVRGLTGWRRPAFAFVAGLLSALSFAPFGLLPLLLLGCGALVLLIDGAQSDAHPIRAAALAGWAFAFGQFLAGLYWIGYAFLVDAADHLWQMPFIMTLLPGGLALLNTVPGGRVSTTGPTAVRLSEPSLPETAMRRR